MLGQAERDATPGAVTPTPVSSHDTPSASTPNAVGR
jgi:hypothetical protein